MGAGRKITVYTPERLEQIENDILEYTENTEIPVLAEFAYLNGIIREELYKHKELSYAIKMLMAKKEYSLERKAIDGTVIPSFAIFSLKQMGWTDKQNIELSGNEDKPIRMVSISEIMGNNNEENS
jgi:hypothetical protein